MGNSRFIMVFVAVLPAALCTAQADTAWFDKDWKASSKKEAAFFRLPPEKMDTGFLVTDYFVNGNIQMQGKSISAEKNIWKGWVQWFFENGKLKQKGLYVYNRLDSLVTFHPNGKIESTRPYRNNLMEGEIVLYDSSGGLQAKLPFKGGEREGVSRRYYPDGALFSETPYAGGKQQGVERFFDKNGRLTLTETYDDDEREGPVETFYPSGKLERRVMYARGKKTGPETSYYENGRLKEKVFNEDYNRTGLAEGFYSNGAIRFRGNYADGYLAGSWLFFDSLGNPALEADFLQGRLNGSFKIHKKEKLLVDAVFSKGRLLQWTGFSPDGKKYRTATGTDSLTEIWTTWNSAGQQILETQYIFNKAFGEWKLYNEHGLYMQVKTNHSSPEKEKRYRKNAMEEEWKRDELDPEEITPEMIEATTDQFSEIEQVQGGLPEHYFRDELDLLTKEDFTNRFGYPEITRFYGNGAIRIERKTDFEYSPPILVIDSTAIGNPGVVLPAEIQYRLISHADGLQLIVQHETLKPAPNEILVFAEPPSEAIQRVLRISIGPVLKGKLITNPPLILQLNSHLLAQYGNGFTPGEMAEQLCMAIFDTK